MAFTTATPYGLDCSVEDLLSAFSANLRFVKEHIVILPFALPFRSLRKNLNHRTHLFLFGITGAAWLISLVTPISIVSTDYLCWPCPSDFRDGSYHRGILRAELFGGKSPFNFFSQPTFCQSAHRHSSFRIAFSVYRKYLNHRTHLFTLNRIGAAWLISLVTPVSFRFQDIQLTCTSVSPFLLSWKNFFRMMIHLSKSTLYLARRVRRCRFCMERTNQPLLRDAVHCVS